MRSLSAWIALAVTTFACVWATAGDAPTSRPAVRPVLEWGTYEAWKSAILPTPDEAAWATIPWHATLADGLRAAADGEKPILLWVMNGHPLGCT